MACDRPFIQTFDRLQVNCGDGVISPDNVKFYGAKGDGVTDDTNAFQAAINANTYIIVPAGTYRIDTTIDLKPSTTLKLENATLVRLSAYSANTIPVIHVRGQFSRLMGPGIIRTENAHPEGIIVAGHRDTTTSNYNALYWDISYIDIFGVQLAGNIGLYIPSSQDVFGASAANYFGTVSNMLVNRCDKGIVLTQKANAHTFIGINFQNCITSMFDLTGAIENQILGGFGHTSTNGVIGLNFKNGAANGSFYNTVNGFVFEPGGASSSGYFLDTNAANNTINMVNNAAGGVTVSNATNIIFQGNRINAQKYAVGGLQTSPTVSSGTGVPATTEPNGSIFMRTDGTNGDNSLYMRIAGAWVPIFGGTP